MVLGADLTTLFTIPYLLDMSRVQAMQLFIVLSTTANGAFAADENLVVTMTDLVVPTVLAGPVTFDAASGNSLGNVLVEIPIAPLSPMGDLHVAATLELDYTAGIIGPTGLSVGALFLVSGVAMRAELDSIE